MSVGSTNFPGSLDTALDLVEVANKASTTVSGGTLSSGNTTVTVASTASFTSSGIIGIDDELIAYTGKTATTFTGCTRAFESTTAASHADGAAVKQYITAASHNVQSAAIIAIETKVGSGSSTPAVNTVLAGNGTGTSGWAQVATAMVTDAAITYAKIQNVTSGRLLGRSTAGAGAVEEITIGSGLTLSAGTLSASGGGSGTVTNVSVTTANGISGTVTNATTTPAITLTLGAITPSTVNGLTLTAGATGWTIAGGTTSKTLTLSNTLTLAGTDGSTLNVGAGGTLGTAAFTASSAYAAAGAVTSSGLTMATARLLGRSTASTGAIEEITIGSGLTLSAGTLSASGGGGGGTPGGSSGQVQFNSAGSFGGATGFTYQSGASPNVTITAQSASHIPLTISSAATPTAKLLSIQNNGTERIAITSGFIQEFYSVGVSASILSAYEGTTSSSQIRVSLTRGILGFYETNAILDNTASLNTIVRSGSNKLTVANGQTAELYCGTGGSAIVYNALIMRVNQGGTPTAGYGCGLAFGIKTNAADRTAATLAAAWSTVTDGSRSAYFTTSLEDNAITREYVRVAGNGANTATIETATCTSGATTVTALLEQNVTLSTAGNTTDTTIQIPANSFVLAVSVRVTTTIAGVDSTSLQVGDATTAERFGSIGTLTANTTGVGLNQLQGSVSINAAGPIVTSATAVRLTLTGGSDNIPSAGAVRVTIHYIQLTAATS